MAGAMDKATRVTGIIAAIATIGAGAVGVYSKAALASTNERVVKLEAQRDAISESLQRIERHQAEQTARIDRILERLSER